MYSKKDLFKDLDQLGISNKISKIYGRGAVVELDVEPKYKLVVAESNISEINPCFWGITRNVIDALIKNKEDFALVLMDTKNNQVYVKDKDSALKLLSRVSVEKVYKNYKIIESDVTDPISYKSLYEVLESL